MIRSKINYLANKLSELEYIVGNAYVKISSYYKNKSYEAEIYIDLKAYNPETKTLLLFYDDNEFDELFFEYISEYLRNRKFKEIKAYRINEDGKIYPEYILKDGILKDFKKNKTYPLNLF
ncbi:MAG: hypothetical protein QXS41_03540 [Candidatus Woesearchaeota archaeon]